MQQRTESRRGRWCVAAFAAGMALLLLWLVLRDGNVVSAFVATLSAAIAKDGGTISSAIVAAAGGAAVAAGRALRENSAPAHHAPVADSVAADAPSSDGPALPAFVAVAARMRLPAFLPAREDFAPAADDPLPSFARLARQPRGPPAA